MRMRAVTALSALAVVAAAAIGAPGASVFRKEDVQSLRRSSEAVIHARVLDVSSYWNGDHTLIFTDVRLEVKESLAGGADPEIVVRVPGGTVGDFTIEMEGAPRFALDDEVVAFIGRWGDGARMVSGYFQGLSRVERDPLGNAFLRGGAADGLPIPELARMLRQSAR